MIARPSAGPVSALVLALTAASGAAALPPPPASAPRGTGLARPPAGGGAPSPGAATPGLTASGNSSAPIDITAEGVEMFQPQHLTIYRGNVEVIQDTTRMRTPELRVYSRPKGAPGAAAPAPAGPSALDSQNTTIDHIEAAGPFYYVTPTQNARADHMLYQADPDTITLTGDVVLVQGKDVARGDRLVINRKTGQDQLFSDAPQTAKGRVRTILYPQQQQPGAPAAKAAPKPAPR